MLSQIDLIDTDRAFHSRVAEYTFFPCAQGAFSKIHHMLGHKANLNESEKIKITSSIVPNQNTKRFEINYKGKKKKTVK